MARKDAAAEAVAKEILELVRLTKSGSDALGLKDDKVLGDKYKQIQAAVKRTHDKTRLEKLLQDTTSELRTLLPIRHGKLLRERRPTDR